MGTFIYLILNSFSFFLLFIFSFKNGPFPATFFLYLLYVNTIDSEQCSSIFLLITGFELRTSGVISDRSTNRAAITAPKGKALFKTFISFH